MVPGKDSANSFKLLNNFFYLNLVLSKYPLMYPQFKMVDNLCPDLQSYKNEALP